MLNLCNMLVISMMIHINSCLYEGGSDVSYTNLVKDEK